MHGNHKSGHCLYNEPKRGRNIELGSMPIPSEIVVTYEIIYLRGEKVTAQKHISGEWEYVEKQPCRHQGL